MMHLSNQRVTHSLLPLLLLLFLVFLVIDTHYAFTIQSRIHLTRQEEQRIIRNASNLPLDENTARQIDKAKQLLQEAKKKLANNSSISGNGEQRRTVVARKQEDVIKQRNQETGLFTTDGELMAALSIEEEWEAKALMDVFESELEEESEVSKEIAKRDVVSSIRNLKKELQNEDYNAIFDKKNRFIGEDY